MTDLVPLFAFTQIWVKILIQSEKLDPASIQITREAKADDIQLKGDGLTVHPQLVQIQGTDSDDNEAWYVVMERLDPKSTDTLSVTIEATTGLNADDSLRIWLLDFSTTPSQKSDAPSFSVTPKENIVVRSATIIQSS